MSLYSQREESYIATLQRRVRHLDERVARADRPGLSYDAQESAALKWALGEVEARDGELPEKAEV